MFNNSFKPALAWSFDHFSFCDNPHNLTTSSFCSHNLANPSLFIASYPIMPFPSPAIITQDEVDCLTMTSSNESSQANSVDNKPQVPPISRKLAQRDLHGNPVPASKLKIKVKSYRKRNGTLVKKYSRKTTGKSTTKPSNPKIMFKTLLKPGNSCKKVLTWHIPFMFKNWDPLSPLLESPLNLRITRNIVSILVY